MALYDNGTDYEFFIQSKFANVPRSRFDLSRLNSFTFDVGELRVCDFFETLPGDDFEINVQWLLESLPLACRPMNRFTIMIDYYYIEARKLWKGFKTYITRGRDGNIDMSLPKISLRAPIAHSKSGSPVNIHDTCESLAQDLGIPASTYATPKHYQSFRTTTDSSYVSTGRNPVLSADALPFMFYQSIYKYFELNQNLTQSNPHWFPKYGDDYWILPENYGRQINDEFDYSTDSGSAAQFGVFFANRFDNGVTGDDVFGVGDFYCPPVPDSNNNEYPSGEADDKPSVVSLLQLRYAQFRSDSFTTSLPWLMRGDVPTLSPSVSDTITLSDLNFSFDKGGTEYESDKVSLSLGTAGSDNYGYFRTDLVTSESNLAVLKSFSGTTDLSAEVSAAQLRSLLALTVWQERNGYTNGSYNKMIESHFRENPNAESYAPIHIGGVSSDIYFSDVIQNVPTSDSPAGTQVSNALSSSNGSIGRFHSHDYGFIMGIVKVIPDTMYVDGLDHFWTKETMTDEYFPEFANLSPQAVQNREVFVSDSAETDKGLFGYQDRYWYLKTRTNRVGGLFSLPPTSDALFSAYSQARIFTSLPKLSNQFVTASPENVRRDMFAYMNEPMFKFQVASRVSAVRPLPYKSIPNTFGF